MVIQSRGFAPIIAFGLPVEAIFRTRQRLIGILEGGRTAADRVIQAIITRRRDNPRSAGGKLDDGVFTVPIGHRLHAGDIGLGCVGVFQQGFDGLGQFRQSAGVDSMRIGGKLCSQGKPGGEDDCGCDGKVLFLYGRYTPFLLVSVSLIVAQIMADTRGRL